MAAALQDRYTVLRYDHRGHGRSAGSAAAYTVDDLADDAARTMWQARIATVLANGVAPIADGALQRWFTPEFRGDVHGGSALVAALRTVLEGTAPAPYAAACAAVANIDLDAGNARITCPTLVVCGARDEATPPALSHTIARTIPGGRPAQRVRQQQGGKRLRRLAAGCAAPPPPSPTWSASPAWAAPSPAARPSR